MNHLAKAVSYLLLLISCFNNAMVAAGGVSLPDCSINDFQTPLNSFPSTEDLITGNIEGLNNACHGAFSYSLNKKTVVLLNVTRNPSESYRIAGVNYKFQYQGDNCPNKIEVETRVDSVAIPTWTKFMNSTRVVMSTANNNQTVSLPIEGNFVDTALNNFIIRAVVANAVDCDVYVHFAFDLIPGYRIYGPITVPLEVASDPEPLCSTVVDDILTAYTSRYENSYMISGTQTTLGNNVLTFVDYEVDVAHPVSILGFSYVAVGYNRYQSAACGVDFDVVVRINGQVNDYLSVESHNMINNCANSHGQEGSMYYFPTPLVNNVETIQLELVVDPANVDNDNSCVYVVYVKADLDESWRYAPITAFGASDQDLISADDLSTFAASHITYPKNFVKVIGEDYGPFSIASIPIANNNTYVHSLGMSARAIGDSECSHFDVVVRNNENIYNVSTTSLVEGFSDHHLVIANATMGIQLEAGDFDVHIQPDAPVQGCQYLVHMTHNVTLMA